MMKHVIIDSFMNIFFMGYSNRHVIYIYIYIKYKLIEQIY